MYQTLIDKKNKIIIKDWFQLQTLINFLYHLLESFTLNVM